MYVGATRRSSAGQLTERRHVDLHRSLDDVTIGHEHGVDGRQTTENPIRAKAIRQGRDVFDPVEEWEHHAAWSHGRGDGRNRFGEVAS